MADAPLAFFSYSRQDSEFVQKLAKDLRDAGAGVWLDQLDIEPGQRWDSAVEQALAKCPKMLLVLSPASVDSTNVMDEVSFALEARKLVIPVLYQDCKIPFRLRRVQYIDARTDYQRGLHELLRMLGVGTQEPHGNAAPAAPIEQARTDIGRVAEPAPRERPPEEVIPAVTKRDDSQVVQPVPVASAPAAPARASSNRTMLLVGGVVAVLLVLGGTIAVWKGSTSSKSDNRPLAPTVVAPATSPPAPSSGLRTLEATRPSTPAAARPESSLGSDWVRDFMQASQGPAAAALRPYFAATVRPYYGLPSADWAAIERDKAAFFKRFPTIHMTLVGDPQIRPAEQGNTVDVDIKYVNTRNDGQTVQGTTRVTMNVRLVDGAWKIVGIQERVAR